MRVVAIAALSVALSAAIVTAAAAHDFWLQPARFWIQPGENVTVSMFVGHGADRQIWDVAVSRITALRSIGPAGAADARSALGARAVAGQADFRFAEAGVYVIALESSEAVSTLPGARFQAYARDEGLTPILRHRDQTRTERREGREVYSRRAKAIVQVGPPGATASDHVTRPIGLTLEIVPERNPYALAGADRLPVRVYYHGVPLEGARITMTDLSADDRPVETHRTDAHGRASFTAPRSGAWLLNVVWSRPISGEAMGEYQTVFSSLTFGLP